MKKLSKIIVTILIMTLIISSISCSCSSNGGNKDGVITPDGIYNVYDTTSSQKVEGTIHERNVSVTATDFIKNGASDYKLYISPSANSYELRAITVFNTYFAEATGTKMVVVTDDNLNHADDNTYISLGRTSLYESANLNADFSVLGKQGYQLITKGKSIYVVGEGRGVLWGVYDLLSILFNYECYTSNYYSLDKNVTQLKLPDLNVKEVPDIDYRITAYGSTYKDSGAAERMRTICDGDTYVDQLNIHSSFRIVNPDLFKKSHPLWYSNDGQQLCYTAHGDDKEYEGLVEQSVKFITNRLKVDKQHEFISISQQDVNVWCTCDSCSEQKKQYGTNAASMIRFQNDVSERVEQWLAETQPGRKVTFVLIAYHQVEKAPTVKSADGGYKAIDDTVKLRDNFIVQLAPISADFVTSVNDASNQSLKDLYLSWQPVAKGNATWLYDCYYGQLLTPFDSYGSMPDMLRFLKSLNCKLVFPEAATQQSQNTNFDNLKTYYFSKLMWNVNLDLNDVINSYFEGLYREGSEIMKQAFWQMRAELYRHKLLGRDGSVWTDTMTSEYYSKRYLVKQIDTINAALSCYEKYKDSEPEYYTKIRNEVILETLGARFMLIKLYGGTFSDYQYAEMRGSWIADARRLRLDQITSYSTFDDYIKTL